MSFTSTAGNSFSKYFSTVITWAVILSASDEILCCPPNKLMSHTLDVFGFFRVCFGVYFFCFVFKISNTLL